MYIIDTNVLSEWRKNERADIGVRNFFAEADAAKAALFVSVISLGEIRRGIEAKRHQGDLPQSRILEKWLTFLKNRFYLRTLSIDEDICESWARLRVPSPENAIDKLIAATALEHGLTVVTRNERDFRRTGVNVLNPFSDALRFVARQRPWLCAIWMRLSASYSRSMTGEHSWK